MVEICGYVFLTHTSADSRETRMEFAHVAMPVSSSFHLGTTHPGTSWGPDNGEIKPDGEKKGSGIRVTHIPEVDSLP
jgi:hypothetical protein